MAKKENTIKKDFKISIEKNKELEKYANRYYDGNVSMAIREFIDKGLSINSYKEEISFLREMIREELSTELEPKMNRLIKIMVKGSVMSSATYFLCAKVIAKFVPIGERENFKETLKEAKKIGATYVKDKDFKIEEYAENIIESKKTYWEG